MSIPLSTLDDRSYDDLREEALALIPHLAPQWTNHNPSDPGITLVELFAWLTEMLIYRVNRLPEANTHAFLRLLNGPGWMPTPGKDLQEDIRSTVLDLRRRHRAVTAEDYEMLAREASTEVARARCVPRRDLAATTEVRRLVPREGYVSLIVVPYRKQTESLDPASRKDPPLPGSDLLSVVSAYLEPRRLITVREAVVPPVYVPIQTEIVIAARPDVPVKPLRDGVVEALKRYLDPLTGGPDGQGWPFGRDVHVSDLYRLLEKEAPGVDYVPDITLSSTCPENAPRYAAGGALWHETGDPIGIGLSAHHLPWLQIEPRDIVIGSALLPVRVHVDAMAKEGIDPAVARRTVKAAVKRLFHLLHDGPGGPMIWTTNTKKIEAAVLLLPEIAAVTAVTVEAAPDRLFNDDGAAGVRFEAGEIADVTVTAEIQRRRISQ